MKATLLRPSSREVEFTRALRTLVKNHVLTILKQQLLAPDGILAEIGTAIDQIPLYQLAEQAKMSVPVTQEVLNFKWFQNTLTLLRKYYDEFPDDRYEGVTSRKIEGYYGGMNMRGNWDKERQMYDGIDAGDSCQLDRRLREARAAGYMRSEQKAKQLLWYPTPLLLQS